MNEIEKALVNPKKYKDNLKKKNNNTKSCYWAKIMKIHEFEKKILI